MFNHSISDPSNWAVLPSYGDHLGQSISFHLQVSSSHLSHKPQVLWPHFPHLIKGRKRTLRNSQFSPNPNCRSQTFTYANSQLSSHLVTYPTATSPAGAVPWAAYRLCFSIRRQQFRGWQFFENKQTHQHTAEHKLWVYSAPGWVLMMLIITSNGWKGRWDKKWVPGDFWATLFHFLTWWHISNFFSLSFWL